MTGNRSADALGEAWSNILKFFRALGGVAENITPSPAGRGLLAEDMAKPVALHVPHELIADVDDIEFHEGHIRLKSTIDFLDVQREFFAKYHEDLSWERHGRTESANLIAALDSLPENVRALLTADFQCEDLLEGDANARAQRHFLRSRCVRVGDSDYLVPVLELANHSAAGLAYQMGPDLDLRGQVQEEVRIAFGAHDSFSAFRTFGTAGREPGAFSLPAKVTGRSPEILVQRDTNRLVKRGKNWVPQLSSETGQIELSCLMIGHQRFPRLSRGIFCALLREAGYGDPDEAFDQIQAFNWTRYLKLLEVLEPYHGEIITTLRKMARFQLETMSHCVGSRELEPSSIPTGEVWEISIQ